MCVSARVVCFTIFMGFENWELTVLVGSNSFVGTKMLDPTSLNGSLRVKTSY